MNNVKNLQIVPLFGLDQANTKYQTNKSRIQDKVNTSKNNLIEYKNNLNLLSSIFLNNKGTVILTLAGKINKLSNNNNLNNIENQNNVNNFLFPVKKENNVSTTLPNNIPAFTEISSIGHINNLEDRMNMDIMNSNYINSFFKFSSDLGTSKLINYNFLRAGTVKNKKIIGNLQTILDSSFIGMNSLISMPVLEITPKQIVIHLFYYNKHSKLLNSFKTQLQFLAMNLSKLLKKPVRLELVKLHYTYSDSNILSNTIGILSNKARVPFRIIIAKLFKFANIHSRFTLKNSSFVTSFLTGIKVRLGGRLLTQKVVPRFTVKNTQKGSLSRTKAKFVSRARYTNKNKRGAFSISVSIGHGFF
jgi:Mitochondrial ribosomal protein (VAR1)